jgi:hypothetical protein
MAVARWQSSAKIYYVYHTFFQRGLVISHKRTAEPRKSKSANIGFEFTSPHTTHYYVSQATCKQEVAETSKSSWPLLEVKIDVIKFLAFQRSNYVAKS